MVNTKKITTFNAVKCTSQKYLNQTLPYVRSIGSFVEGHLKAQFDELVCDFIKDESGNWWYVNTRAFILKGDPKVDIKLITMYDPDTAEIPKKKK